jgi:hypothetical protein
MEPSASVTPGSAHDRATVAVKTDRHPPSVTFTSHFNSSEVRLPQRREDHQPQKQQRQKLKQRLQRRKTSANDGNDNDGSTGNYDEEEDNDDGGEIDNDIDHDSGDGDDDEILKFQWKLEVLQHPIRARMIGFGDKDR